MDAETLKGNILSRRSALKRGAATGFSDIQFNMGAFVHPPAVCNDGAGNVTAQFPVVFTLFLPAVLTRTPTKTDQSTLARTGAPCKR